VRLADALRVNNAINGMYVRPELRDEYTVTVRVLREYEISLKAPDSNTAKDIASALVQAGLAGKGIVRREVNSTKGRSQREIERARRSLFSRDSDRLSSFSRSIGISCITE
jgi:endonuclease YncB( thermonuclease family)